MGPNNRLEKIIRSKLAALAGGLIICLATVQFYALRELLVAELLFVSAFLCLFLVGGAIYLIGAIAQQGLQAIEVTAHDFAEVRVRRRPRI
jgi:hypothetical protein